MEFQIRSFRDVIGSDFHTKRNDLCMEKRNDWERGLTHEADKFPSAQANYHMTLLSVDFRLDNQHRYYIRGHHVTGITEALDRTGLSPKIPEAARKNFARAASRGKVVHEMCALYDLGKADDYTMDPNLVLYLHGWKTFCLDYAFQPELVEKPLGHHIYMFGGTPDVVGYSQRLGRATIVERKTCEIQDYHGFQLAGQELLVREELAILHAKKLVVQLTDKGKYRLREFKEDFYRKLFLDAVAIANYQISREDR